MIFVTVGTQLPFDRLVHAVDAWAGAHPRERFFAQIGPSTSPPAHMPHADFLTPSRSDELVRTADLIVAHAGMGSLLAAMGYSRPILILPRRAALGEHRNDHQMATARWLAGRPGISVAWDELEVGTRLDDRSLITSGAPIPRHADAVFVRRLRDVVIGGLRRSS